MIGVCFLAGALVASPYSLGEHAQGGVIFFLTPDMGHGLVAAITDQDGGSGLSWGNSSQCIDACLDGLFFGEEYGTTAGSLNSALIIDRYGTEGAAATACADYSVTIDGKAFNDWFLPTLTELRLMLSRKEMINTTAVANGGTAFAAANYWSSLENVNSASSALTLSFDPANPGTNTQDKTTSCRVRAIRAF